MGHSKKNKTTLELGIIMNLLRQFAFAAIFLMTVLLSSCDKKIEDQKRTELSFSELPDTVKYYYLKTANLSDLENIRSSNGDISSVICLDKDLKKCYFETKWFGPWIDKFVFHFDDKTLKLGWNGNEINEPYILYKKELYFTISRTPYDTATIKNANYGKFDLKNVLK